MRNAFAFLLFLIIAGSCRHNKKSSDPILTSNTIVNSLEIENRISDSIELELSEIADRLHIVRLETLNSVVMGGIYSMVIDENYMVIGSEKDYFLFDVKGRFIRMLLKTGRGPEEFILPLFSQVIRNGILYFSDAIKNKNFIYSIDLKTGSLDRIPRYNTGYIQYLIPDTDTTFIVLSEVSERDKNTPLSATIDYSLIRQDLKGNLLNEIPLGVFKGAFPFLPTRYQMFINDRDTLISTPRFDTLYRFSNFKIRPVWYNNFNTNYNDQLPAQKIPNAALVHYSDSLILFEKYITDINANRIMNRNNQLLILDRINNKVKIIKKLYFKDSDMPLGFSGDIRLNDDQFCIVLKARDINIMLKNPLINKSVSELIVPDPPRTDRPITDFDNPFLLIGKFRN